MPEKVTVKVAFFVPLFPSVIETSLMDSEGKGVAVGLGVAVAVGRGVAVAVGRGVAVPVGRGVEVGEGVAVTVGRGVAVAIGEGVAVAVGRGVAVAVAVGRGVAVAVAVGEGVEVGRAVAVGEGVAVAVGGGVKVRMAENSLVLPAGSVAVALITLLVPLSGSVAENEALPLASVVTFWNPRNFWPSPNPIGSAAALEKNSMRNVVFAVELSVPETTLPTTLVMMG